MPPKKTGGKGITFSEYITGDAANPPTKPFNSSPPEVKSCYYTSSFIGGKKKSSGKPKSAKK